MVGDTNLEDNTNLQEEVLKAKKEKLPWEVPEGKLCDRCGEHKACHIYTEGTMALVHGSYSHYCTCCLFVLKLNHALEQAAKVPSIRQALKIALDGCK